MLNSYETSEIAKKPARRNRLALVALALLTAVTAAGIATVAPVVTAPVAGATAIKAVANAAEFDPGNIVSDAVFFDGTALSAAQVQAFLKARVPRCNTSATGPTCLRHYKQDTPTMPKDSFCKQYKGKANESAARIIYKVGKACGVSQKALLVLLEKEQSLVTAGSTTSNVPTDYKYLHATGFACPDTAPCNPAYAGIFYQLYYGARQYQRYAYDPFFSWRAVGANTIGYNPKSSCGSVTVNVRNQATLGLYYYTPYVPNAAALANMYSTGDSCSSYGNRNFFRIFNDWFGSAQLPVRGAIQQTWIANQSHAGAFGRPATSASCNPAGKFCVQRFAGGYLASNAAKGFALTNAAFVSEWNANGGAAGALGWPHANAKCTANGCRERFTGGEIAARTGKKLRVIPASVAKTWRAKKHLKGILGAPIRKAITTKTHTRQRFAGGFIVVPTSGKTRLVRDAIGTAWAKKKFRSAVGIPTGNRKCTTVTSGKGKKAKKIKVCQQKFAKGRIVTKSTGTSYFVSGKMTAAWLKNQSKTGYPVGNTKTVTKGGKTKFTQKFSKAIIKIGYNGKVTVKKR